MKHIHVRFREIDWRRGNGAVYFCLVLCVLMCSMMMLLMQYSDVRFTQSLAASRSDMIADSAAVYAQSYDFNYNKPQAETMVTLLTSYNNAASNKYELTTALSFPANNKLTVIAEVMVPKFFATTDGSDMFVVKDSATVKSVDVFGDIFVVPESFGHENQTESPNDIPGDAGADLTVP